MSNEIQKDDVTIPGGLGSVLINGRNNEIVRDEVANNGKIISWTLTLKPIINEPPTIEDIEYGKNRRCNF